jgi:hypothetical protein
MIQEKSTYIFAPEALVPTALVDRGIEWWQRRRPAGFGR